MPDKEIINQYLCKFTGFEDVDFYTKSGFRKLLKILTKQYWRADFLSWVLDHREAARITDVVTYLFEKPNHLVENLYEFLKEREGD